MSLPLSRIPTGLSVLKRVWHLLLFLVFSAFLLYLLFLFFIYIHYSFSLNSFLGHFIIHLMRTNSLSATLIIKLQSLISFLLSTSSYIHLFCESLLLAHLFGYYWAVIILKTSFFSSLKGVVRLSKRSFKNHFQIFIFMFSYHVCISSPDHRIGQFLAFVCTAPLFSNTKHSCLSAIL